MSTISIISFHYSILWLTFQPIPPAERHRKQQRNCIRPKLTLNREGEYSDMTSQSTSHVYQPDTGGAQRVQFDGEIKTEVLVITAFFTKCWRNSGYFGIEQYIFIL